MHGTLPRKRVRVVRLDDTWTYSESEIVRKHWPAVTIIHQLLPHRTERAIRGMAKKCGLIPDKEQHIWTMPEDTRLRRLAADGLTRPQIAAELGLTIRQVHARLQYKGICVTKQRPTIVGNVLVDAIRQRAYDLNITLVDLDRSLGDKKLFQAAWSGRRISLLQVRRAATALGGNLVVEWDEA